MAARGLRAFGDGYVAILLPVHLGRLGYSATEVGLIASSTLLGSALLTLAFGAAGHRMHIRHRLSTIGEVYQACPSGKRASAANAVTAGERSLLRAARASAVTGFLPLISW
jgi:MFS family permease